MAQLLKDYGPLAFGVVSFLAIWHTAVAPELEANRAASVVNAGVIQDAVTEMRAVTAVNQQIANTMQNTAWTLNDTAKIFAAAARERAAGVE